MGKYLEFHQSYSVKSIRKIKSSSGINYHIGTLPTGRFGVYKYFIKNSPYSINQRDWHRVKTFNTIDEAVNFCEKGEA